MATQVIEPERILVLNEAAPSQDGDFVLYAMGQAQRAEDNHALEYAVQQANECGVPVVVCLPFDPDNEAVNPRQRRFMLEAVPELAAACERRRIKFLLRLAAPLSALSPLAERASLIVCDRSYLREGKSWRQALARTAECRTVQVETDAVVPLAAISDKAEYAARTIRPKINEQLDDWIVALRTTPVEHDGRGLELAGDDPEAVDDHLERVAAGPPAMFDGEPLAGGTRQAKARLTAFLDETLRRYDEARNHPEDPAVSCLSPYLHCGHISPVHIAAEVRASENRTEDQEGFLEELIIRRTLAFNYTEFTEQYDTYAGIPDWARESLEAHRDDDRERIHTARELEDGATADPVWNAAMAEMRETGYLHNYLRMYWGKRILTWTRTPEYAFQVARDLNNKYFLDGNDPASFANVAWLFGTHDRPWPTRPVFGKVRSMTPDGLKRKFDVEAYLARVDAARG